MTWIPSSGTFGRWDTNFNISTFPRFDVSIPGHVTALRVTRYAFGVGSSEGLHGFPQLMRTVELGDGWSWWNFDWGH